MVLSLIKVFTTLAIGLYTVVYADHISPSYGAPSYDTGAITSSYSIPSSAYGAPSGGGDGGHGGYGDHHEHHHEHPKPYEFGYSVKDPHTGSNFKQQEQSDGNTVRGQYKVHLPDGRTQIVTYTADWKTGFHADVKYEGEATYPSVSSYGGGHGGGYGGGASTYGVPSTYSSHSGGGDYDGASVSAIGTSYNNIGGGYEGGSGGSSYPSTGYHQSLSSYSVPGY